MLERFKLKAKTNDFSRHPKQETALARSKTFEALSDPDTRVENFRHTDNPLLCNPVYVALPLFLHRGELVWRQTEIHPLNAYFGRECAIALNFIREKKKYENAKKFEENPPLPCPMKKELGWVIYRWDFRVWILALCEYHRVLAIICETKCIPSSAISWLQSIKEKQDRYFFRTDTHANFTDEAKKYLEEEADHMRFKESDLTKALVEKLNKELPSVFNTHEGPGPQLCKMDTSGIFHAVAEYYNNKHEELSAYFPGLEEKVEKLDDKKKKPSIPVLFLAEWITLRYARSLCGIEEHELGYTPKLIAEEGEAKS